MWDNEYVRDTLADQHAELREALIRAEGDFNKLRIGMDEITEYLISHPGVLICLERQEDHHRFGESVVQRTGPRILATLTFKDGFSSARTSGDTACEALEHVAEIIRTYRRSPTVEEFCA